MARRGRQNRRVVAHRQPHGGRLPGGQNNGGSGQIHSSPIPGKITMAGRVPRFAGKGKIWPAAARLPRASAGVLRPCAARFGALLIDLPACRAPPDAMNVDFFCPGSSPTAPRRQRRPADCPGGAAGRLGFGAVLAALDWATTVRVAHPWLLARPAAGRLCRRLGVLARRPAGGGWQ